MPNFQQLAAEYAALWNQATIRPEHVADVTASAQKLRTIKPSYDQVSARTNVPWYVIGLIHGLEDSTYSLTTHLHNGDPLTARTVHVPAGRPPTGTPPFSWVDSAVDALTLEGFDKVSRWSIERIAFQLEQYNGWGYRNRRPPMNTPYLWSFTNLYSTGKFSSDGKFDPGLTSAQPGAMAVLQLLIKATGLSVPSEAGANGGPALPPAPPPPSPVPVPTGLYLADGLPFHLLDQPSDSAQGGFFVLIDMPITKIREVDATFWEIQVIAPDLSKQSGFTHKVWLKAQTVPSSFQPEDFGQACLDAARSFGTSAHFLLALAQCESGMQNVAGDAGAFGPFALTAADWTTYNDPAQTGAGDAGRFDPLLQAAVAALMTVKLTNDLRPTLPDKRLPTSEELYLARIFGTANVAALMASTPGNAVSAVLSPPMAATDLNQIFASRPKLLKAGINVGDLLKAVQDGLDAGLQAAVTLLQKVEPDLVVGPPEATDSSLPWMLKAQGELAKNIHGDATNPEIKKYFTDTTLVQAPDDAAWCAAFVSWCIKESGGTTKPVTYSARAADWLNNGENIPGPAFGAVAVLKPLVSGSSGHVGFVTTWDQTKVTLLGGNQGDAVCEKEFPIADVRGWRMM